jgi:hypothetical protein
LVTVTTTCRQTGPVEQLVRLDVRRGDRGVGAEQLGLDVADGEGAGDDVDQVERTGDPGQLAW